LLLKNFLNSSCENLNPVGSFYVRDSVHFLTAQDSRSEVLVKPGLDSISFACSRFGPNVKRSVWTEVTPIADALRYFDDESTFPLFRSSFVDKFTPFYFTELSSEPVIALFCGTPILRTLIQLPCLF
jgi:hypothetical protein